jgi:hypothetical protein
VAYVVLMASGWHGYCNLLDSIRIWCACPQTLLDLGSGGMFFCASNFERSDSPLANHVFSCKVSVRAEYFRLNAVELYRPPNNVTCDGSNQR